MVQTSWAVMALMHAKYPHTEPIVKAVKLIMSRQLPICGLVSLRVRVTLMRSFQDGSWAQEAIEGIFSRTCAISYPNFKVYFYRLDAWEGTQILGGARCSSIVEWPVLLDFVPVGSLLDPYCTLRGDQGEKCVYIYFYAHSSYTVDCLREARQWGDHLFTRAARAFSIGNAYSFLAFLFPFQPFESG